MANFDNNIGINKAQTAYVPAKTEQPSPVVPAEQVEPTPVVDSKTPQPAEVLGRSQVQVKKIEKPDTAQGVAESMKMMEQNPQLVAAAVKSADSAYEMLNAQGAKDAYAKACTGACDAACAKIEKK